METNFNLLRRKVGRWEKLNQALHPRGRQEVGGIRKAQKLSKEAAIVRDADKSLFNYRFFIMFKCRLKAGTKGLRGQVEIPGQEHISPGHKKIQPQFKNRLIFKLPRINLQLFYK